MFSVVSYSYARGPDPDAVVRPSVPEQGVWLLVVQTGAPSANGFLGAGDPTGALGG